jgi:hypothetical protein
MGRYLRMLDGQVTAEGTAVRTTCDRSDISDQSGGAARLRSLLSLMSPPNPNEEPSANRAFVPARIGTTTDVWSDAEEEGAAIIEHDGGAPRAWAEALARLDPSKPPNGVGRERWLRFIDDCGCFLDARWAERAATLGWGPLQLFGCDRKRPYYLPHRGLLWEVNGGTVVALHRDRAIIEITSGERRVYKRQPLEIGRVVLVWELSENLD